MVRRNIAKVITWDAPENPAGGPVRGDQAAILLLLWATYFAGHSFLAGESAKSIARRRWPRLFARYRLLYNAVALLTLAPPVLYAKALSGPLLWHWAGPFALVADGLAVLALAGLIVAPTGYDLRRFLGLAGTAAGAGGLAGEGLRLSGVHRFVRHPWYGLALVLIWTRDMDQATALSAVAITAYFIAGSRLEEAKLIATYGDAYRHYRQRVPGLFPWPGRTLDRAAARQLEAAAHRATAVSSDDAAARHG